MRMIGGEECLEKVCFGSTVCAGSPNVGDQHLG